MTGLGYTVTATDIMHRGLETGVAGIYPAAMVEPVPPELRRRYVAYSKDRARQQVRIVPELRTHGTVGSGQPYRRAIPGRP